VGERSRSRWQITLGLLLMVVMAGCAARAPSRPETYLAQRVKRHLTVGGGKDHNAFPPTAENVASGREAFSSYCFACHGLDGQNTGVPFADRMAPPVPSLKSPAVQAYSDGQLHWIISNGLYPSGMPASRGTLGDEEIWKIVLYIRHLPPAGSLGEPKAYSGDPASR
jgi:mono/diheme cytochrome c family protein